MMKKLSFAIFALGFGAAVLVTKHSVQPQFQDFASEGVDLEQEIANFVKVVASPNFDSNMCVQLLSTTNARLSKATPQDFAPTQTMRQLYRQQGVRYVRDLFDARMALRNRFQSLYVQKKLSPQCVFQVKEAYRIGRTLEDLIGEYALGLPKHDDHNPMVAFTGGEPYLLVNKKFGGFKWQSGDVVLSRGTAFTSAAIAHMGNNDASFSHLFIADKPQNSTEVGMTEALIETGSYNGTMEKSLKDGRVRLAVFRYRDPAIAARAAALIHNHVADYQQKNGGHNLPYDNGLDVREHSKYFCSELVSDAFDLAYGRDSGIPAFPSSVVKKSPYFMQRIGVTVKETFLPVDIETDPRFELVAEWRDYSVMNKIHMHDQVIAAIFDWIDEGATFHETTYAIVKTSVAHELRRWPLFSSLLKTAVPESLSANQMATIVTLDNVSELMYDRLAAVNQAQMAKTGAWLTPAQMRIVLEHYRQDDKAKSGPLQDLFR